MVCTPDTVTAITD